MHVCVCVCLCAHVHLVPGKSSLHNKACMVLSMHTYNSTWHMALTSPPPVYDEIMPVSRGPTAAPNGRVGRECMGEEKR